MAQSMVVSIQIHHILGAIAILYNKELRMVVIIFVTLGFLQMLFSDHQSKDDSNVETQVTLPTTEMDVSINEELTQSTGDETTSINRGRVEVASLSLDEGDEVFRGRTAGQPPMPFVSGNLPISESARNLAKSWNVVESIYQTVLEYKAQCRYVRAFTTRVEPDYEGMMRRFYKAYCPARCSTICQSLRQYKGKEAEFFRKLSKKYNAPNYLLQFRSPMDTSSNPFSDVIDASSGETIPFKMMNVDKMVFLFERLLNAQERFQRESTPYHIDIGFHYTKTECLSRLKLKVF
jgi:hypothetical protein